MLVVLFSSTPTSCENEELLKTIPLKSAEVHDGLFKTVSKSRSSDVSPKSTLNVVTVSMIIEDSCPAPTTNVCGRYSANGYGVERSGNLYSSVTVEPRRTAAFALTGNMPRTNADVRNLI